MFRVPNLSRITNFLPSVPTVLAKDILNKPFASWNLQDHKYLNERKVNHQRCCYDPIDWVGLFKESRVTRHNTVTRCLSSNWKDKGGDGKDKDDVGETNDWGVCVSSDKKSRTEKDEEIKGKEECVCDDVKEPEHTKYYEEIEEDRRDETEKPEYCADIKDKTYQDEDYKDIKDQTHQNEYCEDTYQDKDIKDKTHQNEYSEDKTYQNKNSEDIKEKTYQEYSERFSEKESNEFKKYEDELQEQIERCKAKNKAMEDTLKEKEDVACEMTEDKPDEGVTLKEKEDVTCEMIEDKPDEVITLKEKEDIPCEIIEDKPDEVITLKANEDLPCEIIEDKADHASPGPNPPAIDDEPSDNKTYKNEAYFQHGPHSYYDIFMEMKSKDYFGPRPNSKEEKESRECR